MHTTRGAAAVVARSDDAQMPRDVFLAEQLARARIEAALTAAALVLSCRGGSDADLEAAAAAACTATAELRMALQARRLAAK